MPSSCFGVRATYHNGLRSRSFILESPTAENAEIRANAARMCGYFFGVGQRLFIIITRINRRGCFVGHDYLGRVAFKGIRGSRCFGVAAENQGNSFDDDQHFTLSSFLPGNASSDPRPSKS